MKKLKFMPIIILSLIFSACIFAVNAKIVYKDITYVSIKTNFQFDFDTINQDGLPDIEDDNVTVPDNARYTIESAEWYNYDGANLDIGGQPRVIVYLQTKDEYDYKNDNDYYDRFLSSYSSSNCAIQNGELVSATRQSYSSLRVIFKLKGIKGTYNPPSAAYWLDEMGTAVWEPDLVLDSKYYDIVLYRNDSSIAHINQFSGYKYNFRSYFTKEGSYYFRVRTVPGTSNQTQYGKKSEYLESNHIDVSGDMLVSMKNANVGGNSNGVVGWLKENDKWYFARPDGNWVRNEWVDWSGSWYYFDGNGALLVGLNTINGREYYIDVNRGMLVGWFNSGNDYYFFNTTKTSEYGAMLKNAWMQYDNKYFYFDHNGVMATGWRSITDQNGITNYYYFYPNGSTQGLYGYMATNTTIDGFRIGADGRWIG